MKKPSWFQPLDLIPLLLPVVVVLFAFIHGFEASKNTQASVLLAAVPVLMWLLWAIVMWDRKKYLDKLVWFPRYGFIIDTENDGYLLPAEQEFDEYVASVIRSWAPFHPGAELLMKSRVKWLHFRQHMDEVPIKASWGLKKGITVAGGSSMYVDYNFKLDPLERTALAHELGHIIHGLATGGWNEEEHHAFTKKNGLL